MGLFAFSNISKSFDNRLLFKDISFEFPTKGIVMLLGKSGSGKTTLFNILTGLENKDEGTIFYKNKELKTVKDFLRFRKHVSFVFQEYGIINYLDGYDNLSLGGYDFDISNNKIFKEENFSKDGGVLSGGEKQRLAIIKAINKNSEIIFCDEPTGSLDENTSIEVMNILKDVSKNKLIIMVTHNKNLASSFADVILELSDNKLNIKKNKKSENEIIANNKKIKRSEFKSIKIACKCFFNEKIKLLIAFLSFALSLVSLFCVGSLKQNSYLAIEDKITTYADYNRLKVSETKTKKIADTNFSLTKSYMPSLYEIESLIDNYASVSYCFDSFFLDANIKCNDIELDANIIVFPFDGDIRINKALYDLINKSSVNVSISIEKQINTTFNNYSVIDNIKYNFSSKVDKIYNEFSFLNSPCVFLSHESVSTSFKNIKLNKLSTLLNSKFISLYDRYTSFVDKDDELSSYSIYVDVYNKDDVNKVIKILNDYEKEDSSFEITSRGKITKDTLESTLLLLETLMLIFGVISLFISVILLYLFINSTYINRLKEFALYKSFGFDFKRFYLHNFIPIFICVIFSFIFSILIYEYVKDILGYSLYSFFGFNIFNNSVFIKDNLFIISISLLVLCLLLSLYPSFKANKLKVSEVFKSE